jgi:sugar phosphate isomerase/epimerase
MKVIVSTGAFPGYQLSTVFRTVQRTGADGLEILLSPRLADVPSAYLRDLERQYELPIRSIHSILRLHRVDNETLRHDIVRSARLAASLPSCRVLVVHTPEAASVHDERARAWFSAIDAAREICQDPGLRIGIENSGKMSPSAPTSAFDHPHRLRSMAQEWDLGVTFDTAHAGSRDWDILETARALGQRIVNVHLSNLGGRTSRFGVVNSLLRDHRLPGDGDLPLDDLVVVLAQMGYSEYLTLELSPIRLRSWWLPAAERNLRQAIERCRVEAHQLHPFPRSRRPQEQA